MFLVTDAFGLQQQAQVDAGNGDLIGATDKLRESNARLNEAAARLYQTQVDIQKSSGVGGSIAAIRNWIVPLIFLIFLIVIGVYLFSRPSEEEGPMPPPKPTRRRRNK